MRKLKQPVRKNLILRICIFAFVVYATVMLVDMQMSIADRKQQLEEVKAAAEAQRIENKELARQLDDGLDDATIERIARENDYVYPDEEVFIDISGS